MREVNEISSRRPPYRIAEAAERLGTSNRTVRDAIRNGRLKAHRLGRIFLIPRDEIDRLTGDAA